MTVELESAAELEMFGERLARDLGPGDVVLLRGELGSGKTTLTRGIVRGLGLDATQVSSPTYVIANVYLSGGADTSARAMVVHIDAYRVGSTDELAGIGLDRLLSQQPILIVEWPDHVESALPPATVRVVLEHTPGGRRVSVA